MIPDNITKEHLEKAIEEIDRDGVRKGRHLSTYDLIHNGKYYPPKLVLSIANRYANGTELDSNDFSGGKETHAFELMKAEGFEITPKNDPIKSLIENYKKRITETELKDETYKWELVNEFRGRPNPENTDFYQEIKDVKFKNLIYAMGMAVINRLAKDKPEELRQLFINLFDETKDLTERVKCFNKDTLKIYRELGETLQHHQDERSIATYLTFYNSDKYTFYKSSFYKKYCKILGVKEAKKNEKYIHYLKLIDDLIENYIAPDNELVEQVKDLIPQYYNGTNHKLLAQDILFQMLDKKQETNYWVFQGNPKIFDFETALRENILTDWTVSAHIDKIKIGDKVILWITGNKAGCYALAEVTTEPHVKTSSPNNHLWKGEDKSELKADIKITNNLVENPILKSDIESLEELNELKVGNQGTNFSATEIQYNKLDEMSKSNKINYWVFSPGQGAEFWEEFKNENIIAVEYDELKDFSRYKTEDTITNAIKKCEWYNDDKPTNHVKCIFDFSKSMQIGDVVIIKKGRLKLLGYGIIKSDYQYDETRKFKSFRKVEWKQKGEWETETNFTVKTLTEITNYESKNKNFNYWHQYLLSIMNEKNEIKNMKSAVNHILYGPPGTGKTYNTILRAAQIIENRVIDSYDEALDIFKMNLHNRIEFITFHQNYSYEDFIQGLRPETDNASELLFEKKDGIFKRIADRAKRDAYYVPVGTKLKDYTVIKSNNDIVELWSERTESIRYVPYQLIKDLMDGIALNKISVEDIKKRRDLDLPTLLNSKVEKYYFGIEGTLYNICEYLIENQNKATKQNYVIIIDEINRANISRVFGELITLIEPDKRSHGTIPLEARLPSGDPFTVPSNLFIIGTMNTADKSIALLDIALRRRFEFESMYPKYEIKGQEIYDVEILEKINKQIIKSKGHDFQIGHAYFMGDNKDLVQRMNKKVIPLLLEYYMNDEKEVKGILNSAGLIIEEDSWPLKISGKND